jgi:hypothetical protein
MLFSQLDWTTFCNHHNSEGGSSTKSLRKKRTLNAEAQLFLLALRLCRPHYHALHRIRMTIMAYHSNLGGCLCVPDTRRPVS